MPSEKPSPAEKPAPAATVSQEPEAPEAGEPNPQSDLHGEQSARSAGDSDYLPEVESAPKPDPVQVAITVAVAHALEKDREQYGRRMRRSELAIAYLNCEYAGSSPGRVKVLEAAEMAVLDFLSAP